MNTLLQEAITGAPVTVNLAGMERVLAFPGAAVILYKKETALFDRARAQGRPRLTRDEIRELRATRRKLLDEAEALRPGRGQAWGAGNFDRFEDLLAESMAPKIALDEDACTGDSLYDKINWRKISPQDDPERFLLALWVGLHRFQPATAKTGAGPATREYVETLTREQLSEVVDLSNGDELLLGISKALAAHLIIPEIRPAEQADPNPQPPEELEPPAAPPLSSPEPLEISTK